MREERPLFSDVLGRLVALTDTEVTLDTRGGPFVVPLADIALAKRVPPAARDIIALERAAERAWPAPDREPLGAWLLRAAEGWTNRANSALALGSPGLPLAQAIEATIEWYRARDLTPAVTTPLPTSAPVARRLAQSGWTALPTTLVQTGPLPVGQAPEVRLVAGPDEETIALVAGWKGDVPAIARHILTAPDQVRFAQLYGDGGLLGAARGAVTDGWLGISMLTIADRARGRGLGRRLVHRLAEWAVQAGAARAYLQVDSRNAPALALCERLGLRPHHSYVTWRLSA